MSSIFPLYEVEAWIDTSEASLSRTEPRIIYGIKTRQHRGAPWMRVCDGGAVLFFDSIAAACEKRDELASSASPFSAFIADLKHLCGRHKVTLSSTGYEGLAVYRERAHDEPRLQFAGIEDKTGEGS